MEDLAKELAKRDRFLKHRQMAKTYEQRMEEMRQWQDYIRKHLPMSPEGYKHFLARNYRLRATVVNPTEPSTDAT